MLRWALFLLQKDGPYASLRASRLDRDVRVTPSGHGPEPDVHRAIQRFGFDRHVDCESHELHRAARRRPGRRAGVCLANGERQHPDVHRTRRRRSDSDRDVHEAVKSMRNTRNIRSFDAVRAALTLAIGLTPGCGGRAASTGGAASGTSEGGALPPLEDGGGTEMLDDAGAMETGTTFAEAAPARQDSSDAGQPWPACPDASPVLVNGLATGFAQCSDGTLRRRSVVDCPYAQKPGQICPYDAGYRDAGPHPGPCNRDSDCTQHPYGQCLSFPMVFGCICAYGCVRDSDCNPAQICVRAGVAAGGRTDGQCSDSA